MYWPVAIIKDPFSGKPDSIATYDGISNIENAKKQIELWKNMEETQILFAYVHEDDGHIVYYENNIGSLGYVNYDNAYKYNFFEESHDNKEKKGK